MIISLLLILSVECLLLEAFFNYLGTLSLSLSLGSSLIFNLHWTHLQAFHAFI